MVNKKKLKTKEVLRFFICVFCFLFLVFGFSPQFVSAQTETAAVSIDSSAESILLPDSPFYFLKTWQEKIQLFFSFGVENKAKQFLHLAEARLAEYQKMQVKGKSQIAERTLEKYQAQLGKAIQKLEELKKEGQESDKIAGNAVRAVQKHLLILEQVYQKVPESAKQGLSQAIQNSQRGAEKIKEIFSGQKREEIQKGAGEVKEKIDQGARKGIKKLWPIIK